MKKQFNLKLEPDLVEQIFRFAKIDNRSATSFIVQAVKEKIKRMKRRK